MPNLILPSWAVSPVTPPSGPKFPDVHSILGHQKPNWLEASTELWSDGKGNSPTYCVLKVFTMCLGSSAGMQLILKKTFRAGIMMFIGPGHSGLCELQARLNLALSQLFSS